MKFNKQKIKWTWTTKNWKIIRPSIKLNKTELINGNSLNHQQEAHSLVELNVRHCSVGIEYVVGVIQSKTCCVALDSWLVLTNTVQGVALHNINPQFLNI